MNCQLRFNLRRKLTSRSSGLHTKKSPLYAFAVPPDVAGFAPV